MRTELQRARDAEARANAAASTLHDQAEALERDVKAAQEAQRAATEAAANATRDSAGYASRLADDAGQLRLGRSRALVLSLLRYSTQHRKGRPFDDEFVAAARTAADFDRRLAEVNAARADERNRACLARYPRARLTSAPVTDYVFVNDAPPPPSATVQLSVEDKESGKSASKERRKDRHAEVANEPRHPNATEAGISYSHMAMISPLPVGAGHRYILMYQTARITEGGDDQAFYAQFSDAVTPPMGSEPASVKGLWTMPVKVRDLREHGCVWSPTLSLRDGHLWLFYAESTTCLRPAMGTRPPRWSPGGHIKFVVSRDGLFWSKSVTILEQWRHGGLPKVIANPPIETANGRWVLPFWSELPRNVDGVPGCPVEGGEVHGVLVSKDRGRTWKSSETKVTPEEAGWLIEASAVEDENGTVTLFHRTQAGLLFSSTSKDASAMQWHQAVPTNLPNPNSKAHAIRLRDGRYVICYNHHVSLRKNLVVSVAPAGSPNGPFTLAAVLDGHMTIERPVVKQRERASGARQGVAERGARASLEEAAAGEAGAEAEEEADSRRRHSRRRSRRHLAQDTNVPEAVAPLIDRVAMVQKEDARSEGDTANMLRIMYPTIVEDTNCDGVVHIAYSIMPPKQSALNNFLMFQPSHDQRFAETRDMGGIKVQTIRV